MLTLTSILSTPESSYLEGKSAKGGFPDSFWESYSAFANIRFGEREGSGLNGIVYVWKKVYHPNPEIFVKEEYDRTFLKLPTMGKDPDIKALIELYPDEEFDDNPAINAPVNVRANEPVTEMSPVNDPINGNDPVNVTINDPVNENDPINVTVNDPINVRLKGQLLSAIKENPYGTYNDYALILGRSNTSVKRLLQQMRTEGVIIRIGAKKNGHWEVINNQSNT